MKRQTDTHNDDRLADFTDRLLDGETTPTASNSDGELLSLEKTLLRLNHALPPERLEEARVAQMLARLKTRAKREEAELAARPSFWKRLFDIQSNPQVGLLIGAVAVVALILISLPGIPFPGSGITGTAGAEPSGISSGTNLFAAGGLVLVLLVIYWISRRK